MQLQGVKITVRTPSKFERLYTDFIYRLSTTQGQCMLYILIFLILSFSFNQKVIEIMKAILPAESARTLTVADISSIRMWIAIAVIGFLILKSLVWLRSDEILVIELPILRRMLRSKKISVPEVTGEKPGNVWTTNSEIVYDAGFVSRRGQLALVPLWGMVHARIDSEVRVLPIRAILDMKPEASSINPELEGKAPRQIEFIGTLLWTPIAELAGEYVRSVGRNCERETQMIELLKARALAKLRLEVRNLTSATLSEKRAELDRAFENSFGDPNAPEGQDAQLYLDSFELEYGITVGDCKVITIELMGAADDVKVLRGLAESDALRLQRIAEENALRENRQKELNNFLSQLETVSGMTAAAKAKAIGDFVLLQKAGPNAQTITRGRN